MGILHRHQSKSVKSTTVTTLTIKSPVKCSFYQPKHKAGLHISSEWTNARDECEAKVLAIAKECRSRNRRFRDLEFDIENDKTSCLYGLCPEEQYDPTDVRRVTQIFDKPQLFVDGAGCNDIVQGGLGDCWFLSALATMSASKQRIIEQLCVAHDPQVGVYGFVFFRDMIPVPVIIDDLLFIKVPKWEDLDSREKLIYHGDEDVYNRKARRGSKVLYFASSSQDNETWVPLVEKAFAKLHGDYSSLCGGITGEAIEDMTGGVTFFLSTKDILDKDRFWTEELLKANKDRLFGCATVSPGDKLIATRGLVGGHAYSVIRAVEYRDKRFVIVRNPWGGSEWSGKWSDGSKEWTTEWLPALEHLEHTFGDDGEFVMEYDDFLDVWEVIDRSLLFDKSWFMSSHWLKVTTHSMPVASSYGDVSFTISLQGPSHSVIVLSQMDDRYFQNVTSSSNWSFDFVIFKKGGTDAIASSIPSRFGARSVNTEVYLEEGEYVIHVRLDRRHEDKTELIKAAEDWGLRKVSRVLTERAKSHSIAANFKPELTAAFLPAPLSELAGQDLTELEEKAVAAAEELKKKTEELKTADGSGAVQKAEAEPTPDVATVTTVTMTESTTTSDVTFQGAPGEGPSDAGEGNEEPAKEGDEDKADEDADEGGGPGSQETYELFDDDDEVYLGLHVYTDKKAKTEVNGQLRHEMGVSLHGLSQGSE